MELYGFENLFDYDNRQGLFQYVRPIVPPSTPSITKPDPVGQIPTETQITVTVTPSGEIEVVIPPEIAGLLQQGQATPPLTAGGVFSNPVPTNLRGNTPAGVHALPATAWAAASVVSASVHNIMTSSPASRVVFGAGFVHAPEAIHPNSVLGQTVVREFAASTGTTARNPASTALTSASAHLSSTIPTHSAASFGTPNTPSQRTTLSATQDIRIGHTPSLAEKNASVATISSTVLNQVVEQVTTRLQALFPEMSREAVRTVVYETLHTFSKPGATPLNSPVRQPRSSLQELTQRLLPVALLEAAFSGHVPTVQPQETPVVPQQNPSSTTPRTQGSGIFRSPVTTSAQPLPTQATPFPVPTPRVPQGTSRQTPITTLLPNQVRPTADRNSRAIPIVVADMDHTVQRPPDDPLKPHVAPEAHEQERTFDGSSGQEREDKEELWQAIRKELEGHFSDHIINKVLDHLAGYQGITEALSEPLRDVWTELNLIQDADQSLFTSEDLECFECHLKIVEFFLSQPGLIARFAPEGRAELEDLKLYLSETEKLLKNIKPRFAHRVEKKGYW